MATTDRKFDRSTEEVPQSVAVTLSINNTVNPSGGATVALTALQHDQTFAFDAATGVAYTLPPPIRGLKFKFLVTVSATSGAHKIQTDGASTFIQGAVLAGVVATTPAANPGPKYFVGNGSTHVKLSMSGTDNTTGGLIGTVLTATAISSTVWDISGNVVCAGTIATPYST